MYAALVPPPARDPSGTLAGGLFWDGRADSLEEQASGPLLNPLEMNNPDKATRRRRSSGSRSTRDAFRATFGDDALDDVDTASRHLRRGARRVRAHAAFAPFSSKYDRYLAGKAR